MAALAWTLAGAGTAGAQQPVDFVRLGDSPAPGEVDAAPVKAYATAFIIGNGLLVTNQHVTASGACTLRDPTTGRHWPARVLASDASVDLALLAAELAGPAVPLATDAPPARLSRVVSIGFPDPVRLGTARKASEGWVEAASAPGHPALMLAQLGVRGGSSGSPVLNPQGQLVGIVAGGLTAPLLKDGKPTASEPLAGIIPVARVREFLAAHGVIPSIFGYRGDIGSVIQTVAPSVFLVEVR